MRKAFGVVTAVAALTVALLALSPAAGVAADKRKCGLLPGQGAYSYVKVRNVSCSEGKKVALKAVRKFCRKDGCDTPPSGGIAKGSVKSKGWSCKVKVAWEFNQARCAKRNMTILYRTGA